MRKAQDGFQWVDRMANVSRDDWQRLANQYDSPLLTYDWLRILEDSQSICPEEGWLPQHLLLYREGRLIGAAPLYVKTHSAGEFVFDYAWAEVAEQLEAEYYPKLVAMSPLSPAIGYRFLIDAAEDEPAVVAEMLHIIHQFCTVNSLHGFSILWPDPGFAEIVTHGGSEEFTPWQHQHFKWENEDFKTFDDYLAGFNKNQRRNIKRERASMADQGISIRTFPAKDASDLDLDLMFQYYSNTNDQFGMWAARYLNREFFSMIQDGCGETVIFCAAYEDDSEYPLGMSMLLYQPDRLIGRYWGAERFVNNLHFNLCYYEPIDWAIQQGIREFDPGMGSNHKVRRGFRAVATHSLHHFYDQRMQTVMQMNIDKINRYEQLHIDQLNDNLPFAQR